MNPIIYSFNSLANIKVFVQTTEPAQHPETKQSKIRKLVFSTRQPSTR